MDEWIGGRFGDELAQRDTWNYQTLITAFVSFNAHHHCKCIFYAFQFIIRTTHLESLDLVTTGRAINVNLVI